MFNQEHVKIIKRNIIVGLIFVLISMSYGQAITSTNTTNNIAKRNAKMYNGFYLVLKESKTRNEIIPINSDEIILLYINESGTTQKTPRDLLVKRVPNVALDFEKQPTLHNNKDSKKTTLNLTFAAGSTKH
jgi:hypothetical protein